MVIDRDGDRYRWRLVQSNGHGADVVARGVRAYRDMRDCYVAVAALAGASADVTSVVQQRDQHWQWIVTTPDGEPLAESPGTFRDAAECGHALAELRPRAAEFVLTATT